MSSLLPLGAQHDATTDRLRRHHAAEAAQGALTVLRAHCLPANPDTAQAHGPDYRNPTNADPDARCSNAACRSANVCTISTTDLRAACDRESCLHVVFPEAA